jgi:hypothetical protein
MTGHLMNCADNDRAIMQHIIDKKSLFISISVVSGYYIQYISYKYQQFLTSRQICS